MEPGIYPDIANEDYHAGDGISHSGLDLFMRSPQHYHHRYHRYHRYLSDHACHEPTVAMLVGTALHTRVLEPHKYDEEIAVMPKIDRRTKAGKEEAALFEMHSEGKTVITRAQGDEIDAMARSIFSTSLGRLLKAGGRAEHSAYWIDEETGVLCRCRPDLLRDDGVALDLKSAADASPDGWQRAAMRYGYHRAAAWYSDGLEALGIHVRHFIFLVVEKAPPYAVAAYALAEDLVDLGRTENRIALYRYADSLATDSWPGYNDGQITWLEPKPWDISQLNNLKETHNV